MINGTHLLLYSTDPAADRAFLRDVLALRCVDAGGGWLIFRLPDSEVAVHPAGDASAVPQEGAAMPAAVLYLMCDDLDDTMRELGERGVHFSDVSTERWGRVTSLQLSSGARLGLYQPSHPTALGLA